LSLFDEVIGWIVVIAVVGFIIIIFLKLLLGELIGLPDMMDKFKGRKK